MWKFFIVLLLLSGCAETTPTSAIVEEGVRHVDETIDYADNNIESTPDTVFLTNAIKSCRSSLISCDIACEAEKETLHASVAYWQLACLALASVAGLLIYILFRKKQW